MSEKYLGAPSDDGDWWCDISSKATDMGPGVSFAVRCGEDGGNGPYAICCYGLRDDVDLPKVHAEVDRIVEEYQRPSQWNPNGRNLQGPVCYPKIEKWRTLEDVLILLRGEYGMRASKWINLDQGKMLWSIEDMVWGCTGSRAMCRRVIERVGLPALQKMYDEIKVA